MLSKLTSISELKERFINERKAILASNVSAIQKELYKTVIDKLIASLDTIDGDIANTPSNIRAAKVIDKIFTEFQTQLATTMQGVTGDYTKLLNYNLDYFKNFNKALSASVKDNVFKSMYSRVGYNSDGFEKNGFIDSFIKDRSLAAKVKQTVLGSVINGTPITNLQKTLNLTINGTGAANGLIDNHFKTYIYDTYSQFDAETGNQFAIQLQLNYAIYAGGLIDTSRPFCIARNDMSFTREEIEVFGTSRDKFGGYTDKKKGEFAGKNKDYIPERDRGGYNCGHLYNWVSYLIAQSKRPDIPKSKYDKK